MVKKKHLPLLPILVFQDETQTGVLQWSFISVSMIIFNYYSVTSPLRYLYSRDTSSQVTPNLVPETFSHNLCSCNRCTSIEGTEGTPPFGGKGKLYLDPETHI